MRIQVRQVFLVSLLWFAQLVGTSVSGQTGSKTPPATAARFTDITASSGISFQHFSSHTPNKYLIETMGAGVALFDFDNDGRLDLFLVNGAPIADPSPKGTIPQKTDPKHWNQLYHQERDGTFKDVTEKAGVQGTGYGMGVAVGDYDNDGYEDFYVTAYGGNQLYHNNGDGTFTDVSKESGIAKSLGKAWGVVACDINNDGWMDLFVANDTVQNFLFANRQGKFEEIGMLAGVGFSSYGRPRSGMGVDAADYDQDGWVDLFVANVDQEMYSLYHNNKDESFADVAVPSGIGSATHLMSGWGLKFLDYDNDGDLDLILCNGHPDDKIDGRVTGVKYLEPMLLFRNTPSGLKNVSAQSGSIFSKPLAARGLAIGDFDNDGGVDVLVSVNGGAPVLLKNNAGAQNNWLGIKLVGKKSNPDAIGARISYQSGDLKRSRMKVGGGSYLSSHDPRVVLGLGARRKMDWLELKWPLPGGSTQRFTELPLNRYITIIEGENKWS